MIDQRDGRIAKLGMREWRVVAALDGTRDLEGIRLASGISDVASLVAELERQGWLGEQDGDAPSFAADRPIVALPDYRFSCTGAGHCCRMFSTIVFSPREAARAQSLLPIVESDPEAGFLPLNGLEPGAYAGPMRNGCCAYLEGSRCRLHSAHGAEAKPLGCRTFPVRYVDNGTEIRATVAIECACVLASEDGDPLTTAKRGSDLPREVHVRVVPDRARIGDREVGRAEYFEWEASLSPTKDLVYEVDPDLAIRIDRAIARHSWRDADDIVLRGLRWLRIAVDRDGPANERDEALYWRAAIHGHLFALDGDANESLRTIAMHIRLARALPDEAEQEHPLGLVGALIRGYGLL